MTVVGSNTGDSSPPDVMLPKDVSEPLGLHIQHIPLEDGAGGPDINSSPVETTFDLEEGVNPGPNVEHQFIPSFNGESIIHRDDQQERLMSGNLSILRNASDEDIQFCLQLGKNEPKRRRSEPIIPWVEEPWQFFSFSTFFSLKEPWVKTVTWDKIRRSLIQFVYGIAVLHVVFLASQAEAERKMLKCALFLICYIAIHFLVF